MKTQIPRSAGLAALWFLALIPSTQAHSWVEQLSVIAPNGTFTGAPGFPRGNVLRTVSGFNDDLINNLIPPNGRSTGNAILPTDLMCKKSQTIGNQTPGSPALKASPGDMVALRYQENGHVTLPATQAGKPANRGTVFIYGTTQPSNDDTLLGIHNVWTPDGKGGDGRGVLLATRNFDDGQCYQVNSGAISQDRQKNFPKKADSLMGGNLWCQADVKLPTSVAGADSYTLYWVWDWPTAPGTPGFPNGLNETYTTCMDISLAAGSGSSNPSDDKFIKGQDLNKAAIESEMSTALIVPLTGTATGQPAVPTSPPHSETTQTGTSTPTSKGGQGATVTVTEKILETLTIYKTLSPSDSNSPSQPTSVVTGSGNSIEVSPFLAATDVSSPSRAAPTTLLTSTSRAVVSEAIVIVTTTDDVLVVETVTASATPRGAKFRGRTIYQR